MPCEVILVSGVCNATTFCRGRAGARVEGRGESGDGICPIFDTPLRTGLVRKGPISPWRETTGHEWNRGVRPIRLQTAGPVTRFCRAVPLRTLDKLRRDFTQEAGSILPLVLHSFREKLRS